MPGPRAGTAEVHWQTTILRSAFPDDGGVGISNALQGIYRSSLESLKQMGGLKKCKRVGYATSADTSGDKSRVVGYAGMLLA